MAAVLALVLAAALAHAGWNTILKGRSERGAIVAVATLVATGVLLPAAWFSWRPPSPEVLALVAASSAAEFAYFRALNAAYNRGDLGAVYPLARGSAPVYVAGLAALVLQERLSLLGYAGILLVAIGAVLVNLPDRSVGWAWPAIGLALVTGGLIATYTLIDKVGATLYPPPIYLMLIFALTGSALTAQEVARAGGAKLRALVRREWAAILLVGLLVPVTYLLVLFAFRLAPVSLVAPLREISIVFATLLGRLCLAEPLTAPRLGGSLTICGGVMALSLS